VAREARLLTLRFIHHSYRLSQPVALEVQRPACAAQLPARRGPNEMPDSDYQQY
jgi:hypothetical protein